MLAEQRLKDLRRLHLVGVGAVGRVEVRRGHERVQDDRFRVVGIGCGELPHFLLESRHPRTMIEGVPVADERLNRRDVSLLALIVKAGGPRVLERGGDGVEFVRRQASGPEERVVEHDHGTPPMGYAALGVLLGDGLEGLPGV